MTVEIRSTRNLRSLFSGAVLAALANLLFAVTRIRVLSFTI